MKRILVTGGFGFIGSHLVERLLNDEHHVTVVDDLSNNPVPLSQLLTEIKPSSSSNLEWSLETIGEFAARFPGYDLGYEEIYHLASPVGPAGVLQHTGHMVGQIVLDVYLLIDLAFACGARLLDVSTSEVYGGGQNGLCVEDMARVIQANPTARLEYAVAKLAAEVAIANTCHVSKLDAVIVRPFNVAGPRQSDIGGFVLPRFVKQAMADDDITVFGDGSQVRAFTHVKDIVDGLVLAMERGESGEVYNLGNPDNRITIMDLAKRVQGIVGGGRIILTNGKAIYGDAYEEAADKFPDSSKAMQQLGWKPSIGVDETIQNVYDYLCQTIQQPLSYTGGSHLRQ